MPGHRSARGPAQLPSHASISPRMEVRPAQGGTAGPPPPALSSADLIQRLRSALLAKATFDVAGAAPQPQRVTPSSCTGAAARPAPAARPSSDDNVQSDSRASSQGVLQKLPGVTDARRDLASEEGEDGSDSDIDIGGGPVVTPTTTGAVAARGGKRAPAPLTCLFRRPDLSPQREEWMAGEEGLRRSPDQTSEGSTALHLDQSGLRGKNASPASAQQSDKLADVARDGSPTTAGTGRLAVASDLAYEVAQLPAMSLLYFIKELNEQLPPNLAFKLVSNQ